MSCFRLPVRIAPKASIEAEFLAMVAYKIQDRANSFAVALAQAPTQLLDKKRRTIGRAQHEQRIHFRNIDAFVEQVH